MAKTYFAVGQVNVSGTTRTIGILVPKFRFAKTVKPGELHESTVYTAEDALKDADLITQLVASKASGIVKILTGEEAEAAKADADQQSEAQKKTLALAAAKEHLIAVKATYDAAVKTDPEEKEKSTQSAKAGVVKAQEDLIALI